MIVPVTCWRGAGEGEEAAVADRQAAAAADDAVEREIAAAARAIEACAAGEADGVSEDRIAGALERPARERERSGAGGGVVCEDQRPLAQRQPAAVAVRAAQAHRSRARLGDAAAGDVLSRCCSRCRDRWPLRRRRSVKVLLFVNSVSAPGPLIVAVVAAALVESAPPSCNAPAAPLVVICPPFRTTLFTWSATAFSCRTPELLIVIVPDPADLIGGEQGDDVAAAAVADRQVADEGGDAGGLVQAERAGVDGGRAGEGVGAAAGDREGGRAVLGDVARRR